MGKPLHQTQQWVGALDDFVLIELIGGRVADGLGGAILLSRPIRLRRPAVIELDCQLFFLVSYPLITFPFLTSLPRLLT
jgi:hypothetical protein